MSINQWTNQISVAITVTDSKGVITDMNPTSIATFTADGGSKLIGSDVLACHPEPSRTKLAEMYETRLPNHYTIRKNGQKKIIHQIPLFDGEEFKGNVEISIPIPDSLPHFDRI